MKNMIENILKSELEEELSVSDKNSKNDVEMSDSFISQLSIVFKDRIAGHLR